MMLFRRSQVADLDGIHALALASGFIGLTTLPKDRELLQARLEWSSESFDKQVERAANEYYFFVLEDTQTSEIIGCSAIEAYTGYEVPFYSYRLSKRTRICPSLGIRSDYEVLNLVNDFQDRSELCTLFLRADYRKNQCGLLLSKARFLFMAQFLQRFAENAIAELRGVSDENGHSPFWENLGRHFFQVPFADADNLTVSSNKQFIADLMPRNPIYVKLLSTEAQNVIGKPHNSAIAAMNILLREGFHYTRCVDIFDAGPTIEAPIKQIHTIKASQLVRISSLSDSVSSRSFLLANTCLDFKATVAEVMVNEERHTGIISKDTAKLLALNIGDMLRVAPLKDLHETSK